MTSNVSAPVTLERGGKALISKKSPLKATLKWHGREGKDSGDLDFYCFYVTNKNETGKIYYKNMGGNNKPPYIQLTGDSKNPGEETILIERPEELKYVLFAAYSAAENGIGSFYSYNAYVMISNTQDKSVVAPLLEKNNQSYWVAIAKIDFTLSRFNGEISQIENYSSENDERSPILKTDGEIEMDAGEIEFKDFDLKFKKIEN